MDTSDQIPRALVPQACYPTIDGILKDLKLCSRRIQHAQAIHTDEFQLLQRIYYKNKNQHRGALFWRRVAEMRRYSERLNNINILATLDQIRKLFFGPDAKQNPKLLKGSWTHTPIKKDVVDVVSHFRTYEVLLQKMQERLLQAYGSFTLAMQTGAFAQLFLVLVGIVSRLRMVSTEINEALSTACSSLDQFLLLEIATPSNQIIPLSGTTSSALSITIDAGTEGPVNTEIPAANQAMEAVPRLVVQRRSEPGPTILHDARPGGVQSKAKKVKKTRNEIDDIFSVM